MKFFSSILHFFASLFEANGNIAQKVLHDVSSYVSLAEPIVAGIETEIKTLEPTPGALVTGIEKFLAKYESDAAKVAATAAALAALPSADLWKNLAVAALQTFVPVGTAASALNLAIEFAYSIFKAKQPAN